MHGGILCPCIIFMGHNARFNNSLPIKIRRKCCVSSLVNKVITQAIFVHQKYQIFYKTKQIILDHQKAPEASLKSLQSTVSEVLNAIRAKKNNFHFTISFSTDIRPETLSKSK